MLGFRRVWASPDRVMWSRGYDHFVMRQAKDGVSYGPGALWLAVSAESRAQVDQVLPSCATPGAEILQPPKELDYFAPGYYSVGFRDPDGVPIEVVHRWDELPELADAEQVRVPGHGVSLGGYFFKPQAGHAALSGADPAARLRRPRPQHGGPGARRVGQRLCRPRPVAARLAGLGGRERPGPAPAARRAGGDRLAGQAAAGRPRPAGAGRRLDGRPGGAAGGRPQAADQGRRLVLRRDRSGALARGQSRSCATISTISAGRRACRCARRSCGWRRSTCRCC